ncbi:MAG: sugar transferase [Bacteroidota bacterium]
MNTKVTERISSLIVSGNIGPDYVSKLESRGYRVILSDFFKLSGQLIIEDASAELFFIEKADIEMIEKLFLMLNSVPSYKRRSRIVICDGGHIGAAKKLRRYVDDIYDLDVEVDRIIRRIKDLKYVRKAIPITTHIFPPQSFQVPRWKRIFDIVVSLLILLMISPLLLFIILCIKLDSKGPVFYTSRRVGTGYKIFDFYKFRSMKVNADKLISSMDHLNSYQDEEEEKLEDLIIGGTLLISDEGQTSEEEIEQEKEKELANTFFKAANDPRITKIGKIIRGLSLDELPQLLNVLKGDMSIVGNRPLPLYEAEKLTSDEWASRFMAPAGITGLWQVNDFAHAKLSPEERKQLDNEYAEKFSLWMDIKILLKTLPAMVLHE